MVPSSASTVHSALSTPDQSPEPVTGTGVRNLTRTLDSVASEGGSSRAFDRALQATSRIEEAMRAKGWKLNK